MSEVEFKPWGKITRCNKDFITVTEKLDGTNACVVIRDGEVVAVQSRKRFIKVGDDNYGFASWVEANKEELVQLGDGYHYGEWYGEGIQKNLHKAVGKRFALFNSLRWTSDNQPPNCCEVVTTLFSGKQADVVLDDIMIELETNAADLGYTPEGIVIYYHTTKSFNKMTFKSVNGKWADKE